MDFLPQVGERTIFAQLTARPAPDLRNEISTLRHPAERGAALQSLTICILVGYGANTSSSRTPVSTHPRLV
jgi:hypothetical protein